MAQEICRRLRMSNDDTEQIVALVANHMRFGDTLKMKASTLKRFLRLPKFEEHLEMHRLDCLASHGELTIHSFLSQKMTDTPPEEISPQPLLTGHDLIELGHQPGPRFRQILAALEDMQLEGKLSTKDEALEFVKREFAA
jgi:poly(A) polymerase